MASHLHKCLKCETYTLNKDCPSCGKETILPRPPKFSLADKYLEYKRTVRIKELKEKGLY